jgi:hypothetical protein
MRNAWRGAVAAAPTDHNQVGATDQANKDIFARYLMDDSSFVQRCIDGTHVFIGWDLGPHMPTIMAADYADSIFGTAQYNLHTMATQVWFELLNAGNKMAAWASSDSHDVFSLQHTSCDAPVYWRNTSGYYGPLLLVDCGGKGPGETIRPAADGTVPDGPEVPPIPLAKVKLGEYRKAY